MNCDKAFITKHNDYMTPRSAWENIKHIIPKDKVIWESFYGNGKSGEVLTELGFEVIHEKIDFFKNDKGDIIVSNPPFTKKKEILERLFKLNKPFILLMPQNVIFTQYFRKMIMKQKEKIKLIIPKKRIQFLKVVNGVIDENQKQQCSFDCYYYCWKIDTLNNDLNWLN